LKVSRQSLLLLLALPLTSILTSRDLYAQAQPSSAPTILVASSNPTTSSILVAFTASDARSGAENDGLAMSSATAPAAVSAALPAQVSEPAARSRSFRPLSRIAVGAQISPLGPGALAAVNLNRHMDVRVSGNYLNYSTSFSEQGFNVDAAAHLASAGAQLDYYPFHNGFRLSPGVQVYNQNRVNAFGPVTPGESFELNDQTFYAAYPNAALGITALSANGGLKLNQTKPAFIATTGWGSLIPRSGRHWAIPFEIGAVFSGTPKLSAKLTGWACYDQAQTLCTNVADSSNPISVEIQQDLNSQIATWQKDINPLKVYPIISTGIVFNFNFR
jgi:hypothetical protein